MGRESWRRGSIQTVGNPLKGMSVGRFESSEGNLTGRGKKHPQSRRLTTTASGEVAQKPRSTTPAVYRPPCWRQRGRHVTARAGRQGTAPISAPETSILHQTVSRPPVSNHVFLGSWIVDIFQEGHSLTSAPQRRHTAHMRQCSQAPGNLVRIGRWWRHIAHLEQCSYQAPGCLSCSDLGRAQNACPTESVPLWTTREPEPEWFRPGKCTKCRAHFGQCPAEHAEAWAV